MRITDGAAQAARDFERFFGRPGPRGAVVAAGTGAPIDPALRGALIAAGTAWQVP